MKKLYHNSQPTCSTSRKKVAPCRFPVYVVDRAGLVTVAEPRALAVASARARRALGGGRGLV